MGQREVDHGLVERVQQGDKKAFGLLVEKYQHKLGRLISRFIPDASEIEDITQETFIRAYRALSTFRNESAFYTWLYRIGINTAKNYLAARNRRAPTVTEFDAEDAEGFESGNLLRSYSTPETELMSKQVMQTVNAAMEKLPEDLRTAITLREIEGMTYEDIAQMMNCPVGTVRSRIYRAREVIANELRPILDTHKKKRW